MTTIPMLLGLWLLSNVLYVVSKIAAPPSKCACGYCYPSIDVYPDLYALSSRFSSLRKRQSVLCAMSLSGLVLIIPASCRRSA